LLLEVLVVLSTSLSSCYFILLLIEMIIDYLFYIVIAYMFLLEK